MGKIILFYKYVDIADTHAIHAEQHELCATLNLKGRVLIAHEGINATLGGAANAIDTYIRFMNQHNLFNSIDFKESEGNANHFPRLQVTIKKEIVAFKAGSFKITVAHKGTKLTPAQVHELIQQQPDNLVILDVRNNYESRIGKFKNALAAPIDNFRELPDYIDAHLEQFKDKQVITYCTGGIRCEKASAYLKSKSVAQEVYQLEGGICRYAEQYPDGYFRGKNYVFDNRISVPVTSDILGSCAVCATAYDEYTNCINATCNKQIILCSSCMHALNNTCSVQCKQLVQERKVRIRVAPKKISISQEAHGN